MLQKLFRLLLLGFFLQTCALVLPLSSRCPDLGCRTGGAAYPHPSCRPTDPVTLQCKKALQNCGRNCHVTLRLLTLCATRAFAKAARDTDAGSGLAAVKARRTAIWDHMRQRGFNHMRPGCLSAVLRFWRGGRETPG